MWNRKYSAAKKYLGSFLGLLVSLAGAKADAKREEAHHARVDLIAEKPSIVAGKQIWVGLRFQLDKDWHIYWVNPGDSGTPPQAKWDLPAGFSAGTMRWPTPVRLGRPPIIDYGYENEVLLLVPIQAPANLKAGDNVVLAATVKWVVCQEICIPDKAQLKVSLRASKDGEAQTSSWYRLFQETRERLPHRTPSTWTIQATAGKNEFTLTIDAGAPQASAQFFPLEAQQIDNAAPQSVASFPRGVRLTLKKSDQLLKPIKVVKGVLVLDGGRAYEIAAPVSPGE
jgi:DsbC/DsbD-like thiol-disulfide interchange protein